MKSTTVFNGSFNKECKSSKSVHQALITQQLAQSRNVKMAALSIIPTSQFCNGIIKLAITANESCLCSSIQFILI